MFLPLLLSLALAGSARSEAVVHPATAAIERRAASGSDDFAQDRFVSDETGFPAHKRPALDTAPAANEVSTSLGAMARLFLTLWLAVSLAFGALWAVFGWAVGAKRALAQPRA